MKFLNDKGELVEGTMLTEEQIERREEVIKILHEKVCRGAFHSSWDRKHSEIKCEQLANYFITKFVMKPLPGVSILGEIEAAESENRPKAPEPLPDPVPVAIHLPAAAVLEELSF